MINNFFLMNGYGIYVWSAFSFTCLSFAILFFIIKSQLDKMSQVYSNGQSINDVLTQMEDKLRSFKKGIDNT